MYGYQKRKGATRDELDKLIYGYADAIAQAHEEEVAFLKAGVKQAAYRLDLIHGLKAQVAVMAVRMMAARDALDSAIDAMKEGEPLAATGQIVWNEVTNARYELHEALESAPKVLWRKCGRIIEEQHYHEDERNNYYYMTKEIEFEDAGDPLYLGIDLDEEIAHFYHRQEVEVIVLECSVRDEQAQESEQEESDE